MFNNISDFIKKSKWDIGFTKKNKEYRYTTYQHHQIRIYGEKGFYKYQIIVKQNGQKRFDYKRLLNADNKTFEQVQELAFIVLKGTITNNEMEKDILRSIYKISNL